MAGPKKGLGSKGRGMEALIGGSQTASDASNDELELSLEIDINKIEPNRNQPRKKFTEEALEALAASIKQYGIIQPVIVKKSGDYYELIAGERRWRAAKIAGIKSMPAIIKEYDKGTSFEIALVENLQRENLNPIEEAESFKKLLEEFELTQEQVADKVGKSRSTITNSLRLLNLDARVQNFVLENRLSNGHARALLALEDKDKQFELAEHVLEEGLSVRQIEALVKAIGEPDKKKASKQTETSFETSGYKSIENELKNILGTRVKLNCKKNKGKIEIEYYSDQDLDRLLDLMKKIEY